MAAYLDDVVTFDSDPASDVKLSPSKDRLGAIGAEVLGHSVSFAGVRPNEKVVSGLMKKPIPGHLK